MHFKWKLIKQSSGNGKKFNFGIDFDWFDPKYFFHEFYLCKMLDIVANYHRVQFEEIRTIQAQENDKKPHFKPDLSPLGANSNDQNFIYNNSS